MNQLLVFAKAPRPGEVKTRLAETLGKDKACRAYEQLLRVLARQLAGSENVRVCHSPADGEAELRGYFPKEWEFRPQEGADLGIRLKNAIAEAFEKGARKVCVIGSDCPYLTVEDIRQTWILLDRHELVLGPATDGGYWLIALKRPEPRLFEEIEWGTSKVFKQTLDRAAEMQLKVAHLRELADVDKEADWRQFVERSGIDLQ